MKSKIVKTVSEWLPQYMPKAEMNSEYQVMNSLANGFLKGQSSQDTEVTESIAKIVNMIYEHGSLHDRNTIENEFLEVISNSDDQHTLKSHLIIFPKNLKEAYLKTIIEN